MRQQSAAHVGARDHHRDLPFQAERLGGGGTQSAGRHTRGADRRQDVERDARSIRLLLRPHPPGHVEQARLSRDARLSDQFSTEPPRQPVGHHEEVRGLSAHVRAAVAEPEPASRSEHHGGQVAGDRVDAGAALVQQPQPFEGAAQVDVGSRVELVSRGVEQDRRLALRGRRDGGHLIGPGRLPTAQTARVASHSISQNRSGTNSRPQGAESSGVS